MYGLPSRLQGLQGVVTQAAPDGTRPAPTGDGAAAVPPANLQKPKIIRVQSAAGSSPRPGGEGKTPVNTTPRN